MSTLTLTLPRVHCPGTVLLLIPRFGDCAQESYQSLKPCHWKDIGILVPLKMLKLFTYRQQIRTS